MSNDIESGLIQDIRELDPKPLSASQTDGHDAGDQRKSDTDGNDGDTDGTDSGDSDGTDSGGDTDGTDAGDADGTDNA